MGMVQKNNAKVYEHNGLTTKLSHIESTYIATPCVCIYGNWLHATLQSR